jgi:hypothetical protein
MVNKLHKKSRYKLDESFLKRQFIEFKTNYEYELILRINSDIGTSFSFENDELDDSYDIEYLNSDEYEINILETSLKYVAKSTRVYIKLLDRIKHRAYDKVKMRDMNHYASHLTSNSLKTIFLSRLLKQLGVNVDLKKTIKEKSYTRAKTNTLNGKQINLYERFLIADEVLQIDKKLSTLKISIAEKQNLLSLILGCNIDNAKKIMNRNYDAKVKEELLKDYFKTLKK